MKRVDMQVFLRAKGEEVPFHNYLPWDKMAIVVKEEDMLQLPQKLLVSFAQIMVFSIAL